MTAGIYDMQAAWRLRRLWLILAKEDISDQHRTTVLGPFWLLLNYLCFTATFVFVFHDHRGDTNYAAYASIGLLVWFYMTEVVTQGVGLFTREQNFIKGTPLPLSLYVLRLAMQSMIRSGYSIVGCLIILAVCGVLDNANDLWCLPAVMLTVVATPPIIIVLAFTGTYFPDSRFIIANSMRVGMFLTPIFWRYNNTGGVRHVLYNWNPFVYFVEGVRTPIVENFLPLNKLAVCAIICIALWIIAIFLLGRLRKQVVFNL